MCYITLIIHGVEDFTQLYYVCKHYHLQSEGFVAISVIAERSEDIPKALLSKIHQLPGDTNRAVHPPKRT